MFSNPVLITLIVLAALPVGFAEKPAQILTVCDVAHSGDQLDGKVVQVKGMLRSRTANPYFDELVDENCKDVQVHVVSADASFLANAPAAFKPDLRSIRRAAQVADKAAADGRELYGTVVGLMYVQKKDGSTPTRHKWYPFIIVVQAIRDVKER